MNPLIKINEDHSHNGFVNTSSSAAPSHDQLASRITTSSMDYYPITLSGCPHIAPTLHSCSTPPNRFVQEKCAASGNGSGEQSVAVEAKAHGTASVRIITNYGRGPARN